MAEQERKTFKWGDQEYLLDDLLKLHAAQENNYYDFARTRGQYDDNALQGLRQAITNRINAVKSGEAFEGDGVLGSDSVDNTRIQTQKKGLFRKEKYVDQDNTEWAKYYLNKLVSGLKPYQKQKKVDEGAWDMTKHGFGAFLTGQGMNAKSIFQDLDLRDPNNPEAKRGFSQRYGKLKEHLGGYKKWLSGKNFNFTNNTNEWDDNHIADLDDLITNFDSYDNNTIAARLRKLGAGDDYTTAFTSDKWDLSQTSDQAEAAAKAAAEKKKKEQQDKDWNDEKGRRFKIYNDLTDRHSGQMQHYMGKDRIFDLTDEDIQHHMNSVGISGPDAEKKYWDNMDAQYAQNPYNASVAQLILPMRHRQGALKTIDTGEYSGWMYDPNTINHERQSALAFNSGTGKYEEIFLGHINDEWNRVKNKYMIDKGYIDPLTAFNKEGGILAYQTGGTMTSYDYIQEFKDTKNKERAKETGRDANVQKARDRVVSNGDDSFVSDERTLANPDAGFTTAEKVRLGSIAADIGSIFLDPISGTAVGLGSTLANFGADVMDDGFQWSDVGNLGINVGFDLLGAIPVFGDAVGTGTKIARKLIKFAPRVMAGLAAFQGVANFDGMMNSWSKFASGDKDQKLTVQDWRNIAQSISLVTGGIRATKNKVAQHQMKKQAKVDGVLSINVRNKNGEIEQILVDGKTAEAIKNNRNNIAEVEKILNGIEGYEGKFGAGKDYEINTKNGAWQKPFGKDDLDGWQWRGFRKPGMADINHHYDFSRVRGYRSGLGYNVKGSKTLDQWHQSMAEGLNRRPKVAEDMQGKMATADIDAEYKQLLKDQGIDTQIEALNKEMGARNQYQASAKEKLLKAQEALGLNQDRTKNLASEADLQANKALYEAELQKLPDDLTLRNAEQAIAHNQSILDRNKVRRAELSASRKEKIKQSTQGFDDKILARQKLIEKYQKKLKKLNKIQNLTPEQIREKRSLVGRIQGQQMAIRGIEAKKLQIQDKITKQYVKEYARLASENKTAKGSIATARPIADQRQALLDYRAKLKGTEADLAIYADVAAQNPALQQSVTKWQNYLNARNPQTAHTKAYTDLQNMLNNLRTTHTQIGGRNLSWDMNDILKQYNLDPSKAFKQGGSINKNKITKFLNYAKG